jgi:hypothetical protein
MTNDKNFERCRNGSQNIMVVRCIDTGVGCFRRIKEKRMKKDTQLFSWLHVGDIHHMGK